MLVILWYVWVCLHANGYVTVNSLMFWLVFICYALCRLLNVLAHHYGCNSWREPCWYRALFVFDYTALFSRMCSLYCTLSSVLGRAVFHTSFLTGQWHSAVTLGHKVTLSTGILYRLLSYFTLTAVSFLQFCSVKCIVLALFSWNSLTDNF